LRSLDTCARFTTEAILSPQTGIPLAADRPAASSRRVSFRRHADEQARASWSEVRDLVRVSPLKH
jgi:hypothetical protein